MKNWKILAVLSMLITTTTACQKDCQEKTNDGRVCKAVYEPVCGCNNKTYSNSCEAEGYGITTYTQGECK